MTAAAMIVPAIRPGLPLRMVWLTNIRSCTRHRSSPTSSPCFTGLKRLAFKSTQHGAHVFLAAAAHQRLRGKPPGAPGVGGRRPVPR